MSFHVLAILMAIFLIGCFGFQMYLVRKVIKKTK